MPTSNNSVDREPLLSLRMERRRQSISKEVEKQYRYKYGNSGINGNTYCSTTINPMRSSGDQSKIFLFIASLKGKAMIGLGCRLLG